MSTELQAIFIYSQCIILFSLAHLLIETSIMDDTVENGYNTIMEMLILANFSK